MYPSVFTMVPCISGEISNHAMGNIPSPGSNQASPRIDMVKTVCTSSFFRYPSLTVPHPAALRYELHRDSHLSGPAFSWKSFR